MENELNDKGPIHPCRFCTVTFTAGLTCISATASHLDAENLGFLPRIITDMSVFGFYARNFRPVFPELMHDDD
jgi:hypothetical protein